MRDRLYYDGVRRIQEVSATVVPGSGGPVTTFAVREYVWGPEYVDEIIAQVATNPLLPAAPPMMTAYLTDANYNVTGLVGDLNDGGGQGVEPLTVKQYTWDPYGAVVLTEDHDTVAIPFNRLGHQGLFFERFCVDPDERITDDPLAGERFATGTGGVPAGTRRPTVGLFYARNRWYSPELGRFVTRDPNESALPLLIVLAMQGDALDLVLGAFDAAGQFADGANLYDYLGANPINRRDPSGLSWEDDADFDDLISDLEGHRLYALGALNEGARWASLGLNTGLSIASSLLGLDVFESVYLLSTGRGGFWDAMNIVASVNPGGRTIQVVRKPCGSVCR
ncbi:MAG: hypothetical protein IPM18_16970 [Phycisphaerales bacterium]|nr:hypothetical protein [Phycisphaerales bacterium]